MPISAGIPFDNTGLPYDITQVITDGVFDQEKYEAYSPLFLASSNVLSYACLFALIPAAVVHVSRKCSSSAALSLLANVSDQSGTAVISFVRSALPSARTGMSTRVS